MGDLQIAPPEQLGTLNTVSFFVNAYNSFGSASQFAAQQIAAVFFGASRTSTQEANFSTRLNGYMTSLGINQY